MKGVSKRSTGVAAYVLAVAVVSGVLAPGTVRSEGSDAGGQALSLPGEFRIGPNVEAPRKPTPEPDTVRVGLVKVDPTDRIYFQRCAGCHGAGREGGTGKPLTATITRKHGFEYLRNIIHNGTANGMPDWGVSGALSERQVELMARYLMKAPAQPPKLASLSEIQASWKTHIPNSRRPVKQMSSLDLGGRISVKVTKDGRVALVKETGDKTALAIDSAQAVVGAQLSGSNRYLYTMDCDARITLYDLWMEKPAPVAEIRTGLEGRSMAPSAIEGTEQLSLLVAANWPPQYVVLDGRTLEPHIVHKYQDFGTVRVGCTGEE